MNEAFNKWWDVDLLTEDNPFVDGTPAYWAWEGWCAALAEQPAQQEPVPWSQALEDVWAELDEVFPPAQQEPVQYKCMVIDNHHQNAIPFEQWVKPPQRTWVSLTGEEAIECSTFESRLHCVEAANDKLKEKNT